MKYLSLLLILLTSVAHTQENDDQWEFSLTPYLWAAGIKGSLAADGSEPPPIDPEYSFFTLDNFEMFAFVNFAMRKNRWTWQTDLVYINFADNFDDGPVNVDIGLKGGVFELSAAYRPASWAYTEILFGARRLQIEAGIELTPGPDGVDSQVWIDPLVGMRYVRPISDRWDLILRGDIGGFGVASDFSYNAFAAAKYRFGDTFSMLFGFRQLSFDFNEDDFIADLQIEGFLLGFNFAF